MPPYLSPWLLQRSSAPRLGGATKLSPLGCPQPVPVSAAGGLGHTVLPGPCSRDINKSIFGFSTGIS